MSEVRSQTKARALTEAIKTKKKENVVEKLETRIRRVTRDRLGDRLFDALMGD